MTIIVSFVAGGAMGISACLPATKLGRRRSGGVAPPPDAGRSSKPDASALRLAKRIRTAFSPNISSGSAPRGHRPQVTPFPLFTRRQTNDR